MGEWFQDNRKLKAIYPPEPYNQSNQNSKMPPKPNNQSYQNPNIPHNH